MRAATSTAKFGLFVETPHEPVLMFVVSAKVAQPTTRSFGWRSRTRSRAHITASFTVPGRGCSGRSPRSSRPAAAMHKFGKMGDEGLISFLDGLKNLSPRGVHGRRRQTCRCV